MNSFFSHVILTWFIYFSHAIVTRVIHSFKYSDVIFLIYSKHVTFTRDHVSFPRLFECMCAISEDNTEYWTHSFACLVSSQYCQKSLRTPISHALHVNTCGETHDLTWNAWDFFRVMSFSWFHLVHFSDSWQENSSRLHTLRWLNLIHLTRDLIIRSSFLHSLRCSRCWEDSCVTMADP